jgi:hypothetical protein
MSRSNPNVNAPNPSTRWYEWNGEAGVVRFYDKTTKANVDVPSPFTFLLLDELASVRGWHDASSSGIYSNEVRDTSKDVLVVKAFKGGTLAEGLYKGMKDRINAQGGSYTANCYIAVKNEAGVLGICSLRLKGSALGAWMEFRKANRSSLYDQAIRIVGFTEGKKGRITFRMPTFDLKAVSEETNAQAAKLDKTLQAFLDGYLQKRTHDQAVSDPDDNYIAAPDDDIAPVEDDYRGAPSDDDIPF